MVHATLIPVADVLPGFAAGDRFVVGNVNRPEEPSFNPTSLHRWCSREPISATIHVYFSLALSSSTSGVAGSARVAWASATLASAFLPSAISARARPRWTRPGRLGGG